jgi:hypothetical protein
MAMIKVLEIPFENVTAQFLEELKKHGLEGVIDGDKKSLKLISVRIIDVMVRDTKLSYPSVN